ncbi:MAG: hypothetical protein AAGC96_10020 [Pseudomonadota bacterium]
MLRYIAEETLARPSERLTAVPIAHAVFDRDENFDHQSDPVVRVEARRLRRDLDSYYSGPGAGNPIKISIPKGSYAAQFERQNVPASEQPEIPVQTAEPSDGRHKLLVVSAAIIVLVCAAFLSWFYFDPFDQDAQRAAGNGSLFELPKGPSIAVLPFLNLSGDESQQYVSDGISEQIATELAMFRDLWVLPLGSVQQHKFGFTDAGQLREKYGADYILEGSVRVADGTIRITSRLIDALNANYIWVKKFDSTLNPGNIYDVQDAIAREVSANLAGKYGILAQQAMTQSHRKAPKSFEAYDCVLRYYDYQKHISPALYTDVRSCLERAVTLEPDYAEAWAILANIYMQEKRFGYVDRNPSTNVPAKAMDAVQRAIRLDSQSSTAHVILSTLQFTEGDLQGFRDSGEKALSLNPNNSDALAHYGLRLALSGDWETGLPMLNKAMTLNPEYPHWYRFADVLHEYEQENYQSALDRVKQIDMPGFLWSHLVRTAALGQLGQLDDARLAASDLLSLSSDFERNGLDFIRVWNMELPLRQKLVDGLKKAGLQLEDQQGS